jgi:hypothetical protein
LNRGRAEEQLAALNPELDETPGLIAENKEAIAAARAEVSA